MILYTLACEADHRFESWFSDMRTYDELARTGAIACPVCGSSRVGKTVMAPAVLGTRKAAAPAAAATAATDARPAKDATLRDTALRDVALLEPRQQELRALVNAFHAKVMAETRDVGRRFPEEARRLHEDRSRGGEAPHAGIRGEATADEARGLLEDGIMILPVPTPPDEMN